MSITLIAGLACAQPAWEGINQPGGLVRHHGPGPRPSRSDHLAGELVSVARLLRCHTCYLYPCQPKKTPRDPADRNGWCPARSAPTLRGGCAQPYRSAGRPIPIDRCIEHVSRAATRRTCGSGRRGGRLQLFRFSRIPTCSPGLPSCWATVLFAESAAAQGALSVPTVPSTRSWSRCCLTPSKCCGGQGS